MKGQSRLDVRKYTFSKRTVYEWNKLSVNRVHSSSRPINMFKNGIDNSLDRPQQQSRAFYRRYLRRGQASPHHTQIRELSRQECGVCEKETTKRSENRRY